MPTITDAKILIIATDGFEQSELEYPRDELKKRGAAVHVATPSGDAIRGWDETDWGQTADADLKIADVDVSAYDAIVLPGGQINPDKLRTEEDAVLLIGDFHRAGKPVAAICHGPWLLIEAGLVNGRTVTSFPSIRTDLKNAGATVVDETVVFDGGLITSRNPDDLSAFVEKIVEAVESGQTAAAAA